MNQTSNRILALIATAFAMFVATPVVAEDDGAWRDLDPANTVYMQLPGGQVIIELNPDFAPKTVAQFKQLVRDGFYDGLSFYRVIDGFVAQGGDGSDMEAPHEVPGLPAEFERDWSDDLSFVSIQKPDMFAPETGFIDGFAAARDMAAGKVWLTHCPGVIAMARNNEPDTGSTDFYIVIGQAPRYLDRNLTIFGRVVHGMDLVQRIIRGTVEANGMIEDNAPQTEIVSAVLGSDVPAAERTTLQIAATNGSNFRNVLDSRKYRGKPFFHHPPPTLKPV